MELILVTAALKAIDDAGCDILTRRRVREKGVFPGALWHIYDASDADSIRDLLNTVSIIDCCFFNYTELLMHKFKELINMVS